jgi:DNA repair exonuclease SbcCD ATPase subunit
MKILPLLLLPILASSLCAQSAPAPAALPSARTEMLEKQLTATQKEIAGLLTEMRQTDERIEKRISKAVESLKGLSDSKDSGTRVAGLKADVIDFLRKQITDYSQRRAQIRGQLNNRQQVIPAAVLEADIAWIDARLDRRIAQVVELGGSFARHEDYDKYEAYSTGWYGHTEYRINEDWKANRKATLKAAQERGKLGDAIDDNVRRLKSSRSFKESQLRSASPEQKRLLTNDIARMDALIRSLRNSQETLAHSMPGSQTAVGPMEVKSLTKRLQAGAAEARQDQAKLTGLYNSLNAARSRQAPLVKALNQSVGAKP